MVNCINLIIEMSPRFILGRENVPCVAEVVNRSLKADCTDYTYFQVLLFGLVLTMQKKQIIEVSFSQNACIHSAINTSNCMSRLIEDKQL